MFTELNVSNKVKESVDQYLQSHPEVRRIAEIEEQIHNKKMELIDLEVELTSLQKKRPEIQIEYRRSIMWCLEIDADNPHYFLKSKEGLVKCVEYKHKIKLTAKQNNSFGGILSGMFKDRLIGRITHFNMFFYGLTSLFEKDDEGNFTILKKKYEKNLPVLKQVNR
jgi:hypothetical protein